MKILETEIEGVVIIEPDVFEDARGYFFESFSQERFDKAVRPVRFVQDNESMSSYGVLRGLHYQKGRHAQSKLVRCVKGAVLDVAVELSEKNRRQLFIPRGFAHGFSVLSDTAIFQYKCDSLYAPQSEGAIAWDDPDIGIDWQIPADAVLLSAKDKAHPRLKDATELYDYSTDYYAE